VTANLTRTLLVSTLALTGCSVAWHPLRSPAPGSLQPRQQVEVWTSGRVYRWHGVVITADSVSGVPYWRPPSCDSCRVALSRVAVDSMRTGDVGDATGRTVGLLLVTGAVLALIYYSFFAPGG
jgi:hypothetical protein